jgi:hypothetical protein
MNYQYINYFPLASRTGITGAYGSYNGAYVPGNLITGYNPKLPVANQSHYLSTILSTSSVLLFLSTITDCAKQRYFPQTYLVAKAK